MSKHITLITALIILLVSCSTISPGPRKAVVILWVEIRDKQVIWKKGVLDLANSRGSLEFTSRAPYIFLRTPREGEFLTSRFESTSSYCHTGHDNYIDTEGITNDMKV